MLYERLSDRRFAAPGKWNLRRCSNNKCRLLWLDPQPLERDIGKAYESYPTHEAHSDPKPSAPERSVERFGLANRVGCAVDAGYLARRWGYDPYSVRTLKRVLGMVAYLHPARMDRLNTSVMFLRKIPGGRLLDIGCGSGNTLAKFQYLGWKVSGIDNDPVAVAAAKSKGLDVSTSSLFELQSPDNYFDAVVMSHVLEHLFRPLETLRECRRILRPGGKLVVITPNSESLGHRLFKENWIHLHPPNHLYIYNRRPLREIAERAGLEKIDTFTTTNWADKVFVGSFSIRRCGRSREPIQSGAVARLLAAAQAYSLMIAPGIGEECNLIATKN